MIENKIFNTRISDYIICTCHMYAGNMLHVIVIVLE